MAHPDLENEIPRDHVEYPYKYYYASSDLADQQAKRIPTESKKTYFIFYKFQ
jgi:hypothetical protein